MEENAVWRGSQESVVARYPDVREPELHKMIIRDIIDVQVRDVVTTSAEAIANAGVQSADEVRRQPLPLICYSDELLEANRELRRFLYKNVYYHPRVAEVNRQACEMLRNVFEAYLLIAGSAWRCRHETDRERRSAPDDLRLHRRDDRPLFDRGTRADNSRPGESFIVVRSKRV